MLLRARESDSFVLQASPGGARRVGLEKGMIMEVLRERCAALDISKRDVKACVCAPNPRRKGARSQEVRTFASMTNALLELKNWLITEQVSVVTMEATGDYWKPVYYLRRTPGSS